ncbi:MAG: thiamine-phosphate kinase [Desulfofustis sp.]|nr:thiamine-phosphate kinase [Desulfofustis sp.]
MQANWSELDMISLFSGRIGAADTPGLMEGIGDDCAIFTSSDGHNWLVTTDMLVEGVHFDRSWHLPDLLGRKSIAVNLSDIAAMGGTPLYVLASVALPQQIEKDWMEQWSMGAASIMEEFGCTLIGGDTVKGAVLTINIVVLGSAPHEGTILRRTASVGENVYVSGNLGFAAAGLEICRQPALFDSLTRDELEIFTAKHLNPIPRVKLGQTLAASGMVSAMQDISDGVATDLAHICTQSGVGAEVLADLLPGTDSLDKVCRSLNSTAVDLQLSGGEDYELLFTVKKGKDEDLLTFLQDRGGEKVHRVGRTVPGEKVRLISPEGSVDIGFKGYQHEGSNS